MLAVARKVMHVHSREGTREGARGYTASSPDADCKGQHHIIVAQRLLLGL